MLKNKFQVELKKMIVGVGLFIFALVSLPAILSAQHKVIKGFVRNEAGKPLAWVNIGIPDKDIGTVSRENGEFELKLPEDSLNDSVLFSFVGYESKKISVINFIERSGQATTLNKKNYPLPEVIVRNSKPKLKRRGTTGYTPLIWLAVSFKDGNGFAEQAQLIKIEEPAQLISVNGRVGSIKGKTGSLTYRLNIYKSENGTPGERLVEKLIMKAFPISDGMIRFDLRQEQIYLNEDFFVAFEYIPTKISGEIPPLSFRASATGSGGFMRAASAGTWMPITGGSGAIFVEIEE